MKLCLKVLLWTVMSFGNNEQVIQAPEGCVNVSKITPFGTSGFISECSNGTHITLTSFYNLSSAEFEPGNLLQDHHRGTLVTSMNNTLLASWSSVDHNIVITDISDKHSPQNLSPVYSTGNITSLCFVQVQGYPYIVYAVDKAGLYSYNITKGTTVSGIPESNLACTTPGCLGLQSPTDDYVLAANDETGATFYNLSRSTKHGPVSKDVKVSRMLTLVRRDPPGPNPTSTPSSGGSNTAAIVVPVLIVFMLVIIISIIIGIIIIGICRLHWKNSKSHQTLVKESSPQNHQHGAQGNVDHQRQEHNDPHSSEEFPVNVEPLEIQGQDSPKLAVGGKDCGKDGRQSPLGANYDDPFSLVPRMNAFLMPTKVGDVLKQAGCFVLGEIQTITIRETGGEWNLYPFPNDKRATCAMFSAPPGVVASGKTVELTYGVIPIGPFVFPDGFELASVVIYLDCNDKEKLQKPLSLSLKHCITGDDEVLQNLLCFVKSSHTPQDGSFVFKPKSNAVFDSESGTLEFTDFCLKGICVKKACEEIKKVSTRCYAIPCKIQLHPTSRLSYEYRICLIFGLPSWENVFREYYCTHIEYNREIHLLQEVEFKADEAIQSFVNETDMNGNGWQMMKLCDSVEFTELEIALLEMREMKCEQIIHELNSGLIFPRVKYVITYEREPNPASHGDRMVCLTLRGCKPKDACFSIPVREELRKERELEGAEGLSLAVQQQSPIEGFVPPGIFENRFLHRTPSDEGLLQVIDEINLGWRKIAIYLGVPLTDVVVFESDQGLGGLRALQQWRDGREGCRTPSTWNTLLAVVKDKLGVNVHADLKKKVVAHEHWSIGKETRL